MHTIRVFITSSALLALLLLSGTGQPQPLSGERDADPATGSPRTERAVTGGERDHRKP